MFFGFPQKYVGLGLLLAANLFALPSGFVSLSDVDSTIQVEMRYFGKHNFVGTKIRGYKAPKCILTVEAANALKKVQQELRRFQFSLKVYDCYRPQKAVDHFVNWAKDLKDTKMKLEFYPMVAKKDLFKKGYIASKSGHSRGSTVDLTVVPLPIPPQEAYQDGQELVKCYQREGTRFKDNSIDMGTGYDCFDPRSHIENPQVGRPALRNRFVLNSAMEKHGFKNYPKEWWHYTLANEPFPKTYFDFDVK